MVFPTSKFEKFTSEMSLLHFFTNFKHRTGIQNPKEQLVLNALFLGKILPLLKKIDFCLF